MIAAHEPVQRPRDARLLVIDARGRITHAPRSRFIDLLRAGDLVIANDAATLPASLHGVHLPSGAEIEARLAGKPARAGATAVSDDLAFVAVVFGAGDFRTRTEDRPLPPRLASGDRLALGPLTATVEGLLDHPRLAVIRFDGPPSAFWEGLARHGRPIQYAHMTAPLQLWDVWTPIAGRPVAFEPPSAGFAIDWRSIGAMRARGVEFATITVAAGISSTGDPTLDGRLPFDERYLIPRTTAAAIARAQAGRRRIVAVGTTVVRALEHAASRDGLVRAGEAVADQRIGPATRLRVVEAILSGTHEPDSSHFQLLRAFADDPTLAEANALLDANGYRTHEFGDSVFIERVDRRAREESGPCDGLVDAMSAAA